MQVYELGKTIFKGTSRCANDMCVAFSKILSNPTIKENIERMSSDDKRRLRDALGLYAEKSLALGNAEQYYAYKNAKSSIFSI